MTYNPDTTLAELREIRRDPLFTPAEPILRRAAVNAREQWPDPREREQAGRAIATAAATLSFAPVDNGQRAMLNLVGLFGLALVDDAREQVPA